MAIFHLQVQVIKRSKGLSATVAAASHAAELIVNERTGEVHDHTRKKNVLHSKILAPEGAPGWVFNRAELWNKVELGEKRKDAQVCREIKISLPFELSSQQRLDLILSYVKKNFVRYGMVADACLHAPPQGGNDKNFHAYVLLTMRRLEGDGFGKKATEWNAVAMLESWRANWAKEANAALAQYGHEARIDHRSHEARDWMRCPASTTAQPSRAFCAGARTARSRSARKPSAPLASTPSFRRSWPLPRRRSTSRNRSWLKLRQRSSWSQN